MDVSAVNPKILEDLASSHRTYFITSLLSSRLAETTPHELILYAYGTLAAQDEIEDFRRPRALRDHEGYSDCETSKHFWRGVFDVRGTMFMFENHRRRTKTRAGRITYRYPVWRLAGSQLLLSRMFDFFKLYSAYPQAANDKFLTAIDDERGRIELQGVPAQMAAFNLYGGAKIGAYVSRADDIIDWEPITGWGIGGKRGAIKPETFHRQQRLMKLLPIPRDVFDESYLENRPHLTKEVK